LHLCYQQGLSHDEAASALVWPIGTVKTHLARGKEKLRTLLSAWNPSL
jgi:DNA-directed RNA polymerase specialized sigma24 family protein